MPSDNEATALEIARDGEAHMSAPTLNEIKQQICRDNIFLARLTAAEAEFV
jgi:hypothetical protein